MRMELKETTVSKHSLQALPPSGMHLQMHMSPLHMPMQLSKCAFTFSVTMYGTVYQSHEGGGGPS